MKVIIAGSRSVRTYRLVDEAMTESGFEVTHVISGAAEGADQLGELWARNHNIPVKRFPVSKQEWREFGKSAGPRRNQRMAEEGDALVAIWDGVSRGTKNMIEEARKRGLEVFVKNV